MEINHKDFGNRHSMSAVKYIQFIKSTHDAVKQNEEIWYWPPKQKVGANLGLPIVEQLKYIYLRVASHITPVNTCLVPKNQMTKPSLKDDKGKIN